MIIKHYDVLSEVKQKSLNLNLNLQELDEKAKGQFSVKVTGATPITCTWYKDGQKIKSSATRKVTFVRGEAKLVIMEAGEDDDGEFRLEAKNAFGEASQTATVTVKREYPIQGEGGGGRGAGSEFGSICRVRGLTQG